MTNATSRADQIFARFCEFHADNPAIWSLFERFALELLASGRAKYSGRMIFERIRWHVDVETTGGEAVKMNNDYAAYYSRMFMAKHPAQGPIFQLRRRKSAEESPYAFDLATYNAGAPINETALMERLRGL